MFLVLIEIGCVVFEFGILLLVVFFLMSVLCGDGYLVMVLFGFMIIDLLIMVLWCYLCQFGYDVYVWELGCNFGFKVIGWEGEKLIVWLEVIFEKIGKKVSFVGWSFGGIFVCQFLWWCFDFVW